MVLVEPSAGMRSVSRRLNPECEHIDADMRSLRLAREFDAVFVHDAVCYMTTEADLRMAMQTAFVHCRAGGVALFAPDYVRENVPIIHRPRRFRRGFARFALSGVDVGSRSLGYDLRG